MNPTVKIVSSALLVEHKPTLAGIASFFFLAVLGR
jgi:hypothetical protein